VPEIGSFTGEVVDRFGLDGEARPFSKFAEVNEYEISGSVDVYFVTAEIEVEYAAST